MTIFVNHMKSAKGIIYTFISFLFLGACIVNCKKSPQKKDEVDPNDLNRPDIYAYFERGLRIEDDDPDSALQLYEIGFNKSKEASYNVGIVSYYKFTIYNLCQIQNKLDDGYTLAKAFITFAQQTKSKGFLCDAYSSMAISLAAKDVQDSCAYYYLKAIEIAENRLDTTRLKNLYSNVAISYYLVADYQTALSYSTKALYIAKARKDTNTIASMYCKLSLLYKSILDTVQRNQYNDMAYSILPSIHNTPLQMNILINQGDHFLAIGQYDSAQVLFQQLLKIAQKVKDSMMMGKAWLLQADAELHKGNMNEAIRNIKQTEVLYAALDIPLLKAQELADQKYRIYKQAGQLSLALAAQEEYSLLTDSIDKRNESKVLAQTEKQVQQNNYAISLMEMELKMTTKNSTITLLLIGILTLFMMGLLFFFNQRKKKQLHEKNIHFLKKENEWVTTNAALQAQLYERNRISREIHDELGASLTSITLSTELLRSKMQGQTEEVDKISQTSSSMVDSLNEIIWSLNSGNDSVKSLVAYIRKMFFTFLEDSGVEHHFEATSIVEDFPISSSNRRAIYLTTKEALNNVLKHAKAKAVQLKIAIQQNHLLILLQDDGIGIENLNEFGNGLKNMKFNMESIAGTIQFKNENGTHITISYPLLTNPQIV